MSCIHAIVPISRSALRSSYPHNFLKPHFYYLAGKECLPKLYARIGEPQKDQSTLLLILGFLVPMVAAMIVQGDINRLYEQRP